MDSQWLNRFTKPIIFINTSRGTVVKTADLLNAMTEVLLGVAPLT